MQRDPWLRQKKLHSEPVLKTTNKKVKKWQLLPVLWMAFKKTSMVIGAVVILSAIAMSWFLVPLVEDIDERLPNQMVLFMDLQGAMGDLPKEASLIDPFTQDNKTVKNYIDALERARTDPRVEGIYARLGNIQLSIAHIQELRRAIHNFRKSGKFAYIYSPSFDQGLGGYYLASSFAEIWMQPMGVVMISGLNAEMPYARDVLDKIGVEPQIFKRKEFKGAYDMFTESDMPDASKLSMGVLINDIAEVLKADIAKDRKISEEAFVAAVDRGLWMAEEAALAKLVDHADYADKLHAKINEAVTGNPDDENVSYVRFGSYISKMLEQKALRAESAFTGSHKKKNNKPSVALVYAVGAIMDADSSSASVSVDDGIAGAEGISKALLDAAKDDSIDAVVLRVDSPGGSPVASETILRAVQKVQEEGKTVTVSMGATAASGGYWIASLADEIFVLPTTITGSIGVLGGKFSLEKMWENIGVSWGTTTWGKNASMWSMNQPYSESEAERINAMMDNVYDGFIKRVAKGRNMTEEDVDRIARGRVWSGKKAVEIGLADQFGDLNDALDYAAVQAGEKNRNDVNIVVLPKPLSSIERLIKLLDTQARAGEAIHVQAELLKIIMPTLNRMMVLQSMEQTGAVYEPIQVH